MNGVKIEKQPQGRDDGVEVQKQPQDKNADKPMVCVSKERRILKAMKSTNRQMNNFGPHRDSKEEEEMTLFITERAK